MIRLLTYPFFTFSSILSFVCLLLSLGTSSCFLFSHVFLSHFLSEFPLFLSLVRSCARARAYSHLLFLFHFLAAALKPTTNDYKTNYHMILCPTANPRTSACPFWIDKPYLALPLYNRKPGSALCFSPPTLTSFTSSSQLSFASFSSIRAKKKKTLLGLRILPLKTYVLPFYLVRG